MVKIQKNLRISEELNTRLKKFCKARGGISETDFIATAIEHECMKEDAEVRHFMTLSKKTVAMEQKVRELEIEMCNMKGFMIDMLHELRAQSKLMVSQHKKIGTILTDSIINSYVLVEHELTDSQNTNYQSQKEKIRQSIEKELECFEQK